jgi:tRNA1(Val) A37 N6-methylase TrmN6
LLRELSSLPPLKAAERIARPASGLREALIAAGADRAQLIIDTYESRRLDTVVRKKAGIFYTPAHVIAAMLDRLPAEGEWLDPAAGAGAFLVALARRHGSSVLDRMSACDIDGEALDAAAFALEAALGPESRTAVAKWRRRRAYALDFLRAPPPGRRPDLIVGNPPYGLDGGDDLTALFPDVRGEVDLYSCFLLRSAAVVRPGGTVALLTPDTWLTNQRAASFRSSLAEKGLARILDFGKPFVTARDTRVHAVYLKASSPACVVESLREGQFAPLATRPASELTEAATRGWFLYRTDGEAEACRQIECHPPLKALLNVVYGVRTGSNASHVLPGPGVIPLIAGRDLDAYDRRVTPRHLRDPEPFATAIARQAGRWKLGIQRIRTNSKVSWRRWIEAAPVRPDEVGLDSLTLVADRVAAEAPSETLLHTLGVLNSSVLNRWYRLTFTDVNVKPIYVETLPLPPVDARIAALVRQRLQRPGDLPLERAIDRLVAHAYGLSDAQVECLESGFWGPDRRLLPSLDDAQILAA